MVARDKGIDPAYADLMKGSEEARVKGLAEQRAELTARIEAMKEAEAAGTVEAAAAQTAINELRQQEALLESQKQEDLEAFKGVAAQEAQGNQAGMYGTETLDMSDFDLGDIDMSDEPAPTEKTSATIATAYGGHQAQEAAGINREITEESAKVSEVDEDTMETTLREFAEAQVKQKLESGMDADELEDMLEDQLDDMLFEIKDLEDAGDQPTVLAEQQIQQKRLQAQLKEVQRIITGK